MEKTFSTNSNESTDSSDKDIETKPITRRSLPIPKEALGIFSGDNISKVDGRTPQPKLLGKLINFGSTPEQISPDEDIEEDDDEDEDDGLSLGADLKLQKEKDDIVNDTEVLSFNSQLINAIEAAKVDKEPDSTFDASDQLLVDYIEAPQDDFLTNEAHDDSAETSNIRVETGAEVVPFSINTPEENTLQTQSGSNNNGRPPIPPTPPTPGMPNGPLFNPNINHTYNLNGSNGNALQFNYANNQNTLNANPEDLEDAYRRGKRKGLLQGVLAGGGLTWLYQRRKRKNIERAHKKELLSIEKEVSIQKNEQSLLQQELDKSKDKIEAISADAEHKQAIANNRLEAIERAHAAALAHERSRNAKDISEMATEDIDEERSSVRVEASAWHRVEVDTRTGHAIQKPEQEYGEEFYKEQREVFRDSIDNTDESSAIRGVSQGQQPSRSVYPQDNNSLNGQNQSMAAHLARVSQQAKQQIAKPLFWGPAILLACLAALFFLA